MLKFGSLSFVLLLILAWLTILMVSRYQYQTGVNAFEMEQYDSALSALESAEKVLPDWLATRLAPRDIFRIHCALGETIYHLAAEITDTNKYFEMLKKSHAYITNAANLAPSSYIAQYLLANITANLELIYSELYKESPNPYNAMEIYKAAARLRPYGITVHYEMLSYMAGKGIVIGFYELAAYTVEIFPQAYSYLKKEPFYSKLLQTKMKDGVLKAAERNITPRTTYQVLSSIYQDENDFKKAEFYYSESLRFQPYLNNSSNFLQLGWLSMQTGDIEKSHAMYMNALKQNHDFRGSLNRIYNDYKKYGNLEGFMAFTMIVGEHFSHSESLDIAMARCRMDMGLYELARAILIRRETDAPSAQVYALIAEVASKQQDWAQMELASQRATVLEPENIEHWIRFSNALKSQKKFNRAEESATKAMSLLSGNEKRKADIHNHRAWIRWNLGRWKEAADDWQAASTISPNTAAYFYYISMAYDKQENHEDALLYSQKAVELKPDDATFSKWYSQMEIKSRK